MVLLTGSLKPWKRESLGKVLPRILFPYVQQWAESSGFTLLSRLLVDEQFQGLIEKYGDEMVTLMAQVTHLETETVGEMGNNLHPAPSRASVKLMRTPTT